MINKINSNLQISNNSFSTSKNQEDKINVSYEIQKKANEENSKIHFVSAFVGLGAGAISQAATKNKNLSLKIGIESYFASLIGFGIVKAIKNSKENKEFYKKYEQGEHYEGYDKFINSISTPTKIDFGDEEKNKKYYNLAKENNIRQNKVSIISLAVGAISAGITALVCFAKKIPQKADKVFCSALIGTGIPLIAGNIATISARKKEYENQNNA